MAASGRGGNDSGQSSDGVFHSVIGNNVVLA